MKIIVIGCGRMGAELAYRLSKGGQTVTVVDQMPEAFHGLPEDFRGRIIEGEALNQDVLHRAGIKEAEAVAAVTSNDPVNAIVGHIASDIYQVPLVVVRNFNSRWRSLHEIFGHQVVSSSSWGAQRIEELIYHQEGHTVFSAGNGEVELYEFTVIEEWDGKLLNELVNSADCLTAAITRAGQAIMPNPDFKLAKDDVLLISATFEGSRFLRERMKLPPTASPHFEKSDFPENSGN